MGHTNLAAKKYWQAAEYYDMALEIWPESPSALYEKGGGGQYSVYGGS